MNGIVNGVRIFVGKRKEVLTVHFVCIDTQLVLEAYIAVLLECVNGSREQFVQSGTEHILAWHFDVAERVSVTSLDNVAYLKSVPYLGIWEIQVKRIVFHAVAHKPIAC